MRVDPRAIGLLADLVGERRSGHAERELGDDADGWRRLRLTVDWPEEVPGRLVALGDRLEMLEPPRSARRAGHRGARASRYAVS